MVMTQQYLVGEMSLLLAQLRTAAFDPACAEELGALRVEAETLPLPALRSVAVRAIDLADVLCWESVTRGDAASFDRQAAVSAELYQFGVCAGFLHE
jgi:hypothetical protein